MVGKQGIFDGESVPVGADLDGAVPAVVRMEHSIDPVARPSVSFVTRSAAKTLLR